MLTIKREIYPWSNPRLEKIIEETEGTPDYEKGFIDAIERLQKERLLPSRFQIEDLVQIKFSDFAVRKAEVIKVHFAASKILYDLDVEFLVRGSEKDNAYTRIYNVDSAILQPYEEVKELFPGVPA